MAPLKNAKLRCTAWNRLILRQSRVAWNNKVSTKDKNKIVGRKKNLHCFHNQGKPTKDTRDLHITANYSLEHDPFLAARQTWSATRIPVSIAVGTVEQDRRLVASPAKNKRSSTGLASTWRRSYAWAVGDVYPPRMKGWFDQWKYS